MQLLKPENQLYLSANLQQHIANHIWSFAKKQG